MPKPLLLPPFHSSIVGWKSCSSLSSGISAFRNSSRQSLIILMPFWRSSFEITRGGVQRKIFLCVGVGRSALLFKKRQNCHAGLPVVVVSSIASAKNNPFPRPNDNNLEVIAFKGRVK